MLTLFDFSGGVKQRVSRLSTARPTYATGSAKNAIRAKGQDLRPWPPPQLKGAFMSDQVVLITGALTGIGRAAAIIFAQEGAHIVVSGRRDKEGEALVAELQGLGAEAIFVRTDVQG